MSTLPLQELVDEMVVQIVTAAEARNDLTILVAYMAEEHYTPRDIAYAVEKPAKFADVLAEAKAAIEASS
jgi:hypothetical protein